MDDNKQKTEVHQVSQMEAWHGPLPPPESLKQYDVIVPGAAERILSMAEKEMEHRHQRENRTLKYNGRLIIVSTILAFLCVILLGGILCFAIYVKSDTGAIGAIAAVVGLFTYGKSKHSN